MICGVRLATSCLLQGLHRELACGSALQGALAAKVADALQLIDKTVPAPKDDLHVDSAHRTILDSLSPIGHAGQVDLGP